jgi:TM2 domain-containing membrane protein YozV
MTTPNQPGDPFGEQPWGGQPQGPGWNPNPQLPPPPGYGAQPPGYPAQPGYPSPYPANPAYPYQGYPTPGYAADPQAPFGRDPATGMPLSDKSAVTAGLLQLFLGVFGAGRFYIDSTQIAVAQLCLGIFGIVFGLFCFVGLPVLVGVAVWALVDAVMMFTGSVRDNYGRKLR